MNRYAKLLSVVLVALGLSFSASKADAYLLSDYYPTAQGSVRQYQVTGGVLTYGTEYINGFEDVNYGGTVYSGFKMYNEYGQYEVENVSSLGLRELKGQDGSKYTLFGSAASLSPEGPYLMAPASFNVGDVFTSSYREYVFDSGDNLLSTATHTETVTFVGFEDVVVPAGLFHDALKIYVTGDWGTSYEHLAAGVGTIKQVSIETDGTEVRELTGYSIPGTPGTNVVPEPASLSLLGMGLAGMFFRRKK